MGYHRAGFDVVGVDLQPQPNYPFEFFQADALTFPLDGFDAVHASPPCQAYSLLKHRSGRDYPDLVAAMRSRLVECRRPYVIENVPTAPLLNPTILCGSMFGLGAHTRVGWRQLRRHRAFETNFLVLATPCQHRGRAIGVHGGGPTSKPRLDGRGGRSYQGTVAEKNEAMGTPWMDQHEVNEAIPPAYTEYISSFLIANLETPKRGRA